VDEALVEDRLHQDGAAVGTLSQGLAIARGLGAGLLIWGQVEPGPDSVWIRASLFRVTATPSEPIRRAAIGLAAGAPAAGSARDWVTRFAQLAQQLVVASASGDSGAAPATVARTPYLGALRATLTGDSALAEWNIDLARASYRQASSIDPEYAAPQLRAARAAFWGDAPVTEWRSVAEEALRHADQLSDQEILEAQALVALGAGDPPTACARFRTILAHDSLSFAGWFGLGECLTRDAAVIPARTSPSGWSFRSSSTEGISAYRRALTLVPLSHLAYGGVALDRLGAKLWVQSNRFRLGAAVDDSTRRFAAFPEFKDSLGFVPYPLDEVMAGAHMPASMPQALEANRRTLLDITSEWLARYPASPAAVRAQAMALELIGVITPGSGNRDGALPLIHRLRGLDSATARDPGLAAWETRLLLKARRFEDARQTAEAGLQLPARGSDDGVAQAALAALIGRVHQAADLLARYAGWPFVTPDGKLVDPPAPVAALANRLLVYAAVGKPEDSIRALADRLRDEVDREVEPSQRPLVAQAVLFQPLLLAYPVLGAPEGHLSIARIEQALQLHDTSATRRELVALTQARAGAKPSDVVPDHIVLEARLLALTGDTAAARARLEALLGDLTPFGPDLLDQVATAAALPRAMRLYATLGGDLRRQGLDTALAALWRNADPEVR
jgi:hypothetical protein